MYVCVFIHKYRHKKRFTNLTQRRQQPCLHDGLLRQVCSSNLQSLPMCLTAVLPPTKLPDEINK